MGSGVWSVATLATALGSGLVAGVFFGFSNFIMGALGRIPAAEGMRAMQSINIVVINPLFMILLMGTAAVALAVAVAAGWHWPAPGTALILAGCLCYFIGTFGVTMLGNVPLNNALAAADPGSVEGAQLWARYLRDWTFWNHVRTAAGFVAALLLTLGWRCAAQ